MPVAEQYRPIEQLQAIPFTQPEAVSEPPVAIEGEIIKRGTVSYNRDIDTDNFIHLASLKGSPRYQENESKLLAYTRRQVETHLGERLNVGLSVTRYDIRNGRLYGQNMEEPFFDVIKNVRGKAEDRIREEAEIYGFGAMEARLTDLSAPLEKKVLIISPPGGSYTHNFYDIFTLKEDEETKERYVEARRYTSGLDRKETAAKVREFSFDYPQSLGTPTPEYFLSHPITIDEDSSFKTPDDLHAHLHQNHKYMTKEEFEEKVLKNRIVNKCIDEYFAKLRMDPFGDRDEHAESFDWIMIAADAAAGITESLAIETEEVKREDQQKSHTVMYRQETSNIDSVVLAVQGARRFEDLASLMRGREVRETATGCGSSGSTVKASVFGQSTDEKKSSFAPTTGPWSAVDNASEKTEVTDGKGTLKPKCPDCGAENRRPRGGYVDRCEFCRSEAIACKEPEKKQPMPVYSAKKEEEDKK